MVTNRISKGHHTKSNRDLIKNTKKTITISAIPNIPVIIDNTYLSSLIILRIVDLIIWALIIKMIIERRKNENRSKSDYYNFK